MIDKQWLTVEDWLECTLPLCIYHYLLKVENLLPSTI